MPSFTPAEVEDARRNPMVGDNWGWPGSVRRRLKWIEPGKFVVPGNGLVRYTETSFGNRQFWDRMQRWQLETATATLLERGPQ